MRQRQAVAAENVANSDTPGFKARDIAPFSETYRADQDHFGVHGQKATRSNHINGTVDADAAEPFRDPKGAASPNGNTVSLENEMLKSLIAQRQHDRAVAIYRSSMNILRATLSRS